MYCLLINRVPFLDGWGNNKETTTHQSSSCSWKLGTLVSAHSEVTNYSSLISLFCLSLFEIILSRMGNALNFQAIIINKLLLNMDQGRFIQTERLISQSKRFLIESTEHSGLKFWDQLILESNILMVWWTGGWWRYWRLIPSVVHAVLWGFNGHKLYIKSTTLYLNLCCRNLAR